jgi:DnaJ-class molecular chaperone
MADNFYKVLGIDEKASKDEIKKAYRSLSFKYHPDKNNNSPESISMTQKLNEAYETLSDEQKKNEYDMGRDPNNPFNMNNMHNMNDLNNIFNQFFGGMPFGMPGGMPPGVKIHMFNNGMPIHMNMGPNFANNMQKPTPIIKTLEISMEQVMTGANLPVEIERWIIESGNKIFEHENLYVSVPKGIDDGEIIIVREKGNIVSDNLKGDVKIFIKVNNTTEYQRHGLDLVYKKNITLKESLCGFSFEIKHLNGKIYTLNNNTGNVISQGYQKLIPQMGLERESHIGNLIILFNIEYPATLNEEQIRKLREIL